MTTGPLRLHSQVTLGRYVLKGRWWAIIMQGWLYTCSTYARGLHQQHVLNKTMVFRVHYRSHGFYYTSI